MRNVFAKTLFELADKDENIYLLTADLGFGVFDDFIKKFPCRFINCGIAEQGMMGIAAGLALSGKKVYVYSMVPFVVYRCFEQIRNDICYQNLDIKIIGIGSGFTYGELGLTHYGVEDVAVLRPLLNINILSPADPVETRELLLKSYQTKNPTYIRIPKSGEKILYSKIPYIEIGKPSVLRRGNNEIIFATGICVDLALEVAENLKKDGLDFEVASIHTLKPIDNKALFEKIKNKKLIFTIEEHQIAGGLGSIIAEIIAESDWVGSFKRIAIPEDYNFCEVGSSSHIRSEVGLEINAITKQIYKICRKKLQ